MQKVKVIVKMGYIVCLGWLAILGIMTSTLVSNRVGWVLTGCLVCWGLCILVERIGRRWRLKRLIKKLNWLMDEIDKVDGSMLPLPPNVCSPKW